MKAKENHRRLRSHNILRLLVLISLVIPALATAHESRPAYLELIERTSNHYDVIWRRPAMGEQVLALTPRFPRTCHEATAHTIEKTAGAVREHWQLTCTASGLVGQTITIEGLSRTITDVLVRVRLNTGVSATYIARAHSPSVTIHGTLSTLTVARDYLRLGIEHIWSGVDHLLFVLALLLLIHDRWLLLKTITAFTIAHSLTLGSATLGLVSVPQAPVEAVIALSILFLAAELARAYPHQPSLTRRYPWAIAFIFGLLHGFGFAGALAEVGLPPTDIALALCTFNVGVEVGQLGFIALVLAVAAWGQRWQALQTLAWRPVTVYVIGSVSAFWLLQRVVAFF